MFMLSPINFSGPQSGCRSLLVHSKLQTMGVKISGSHDEIMIGTWLPRMTSNSSAFATELYL